MDTRLKPETEKLLQASHDWMLRLEDPRATDEDRRRFQDWLDADPRHRDIYDRAITFREAFGRLSKDDFDDDLRRPSWRERFTAASDRARGLSASARARAAFAGVLAVVAAVAVILPIVSGLPEGMPVSALVSATHASGTGETKRVTLADGTQVTLSASTTIVAAYFLDKRHVRLTGGAAFFDVAPDRARPFSVEAGALTATALGTEFDVRSSAGVFRVAVAEGAVEVSFPLILNGRATSLVTRRSLNAGQKVSATSDAGLGAVSGVDPANVAAWRAGRLVYSGASIAELVGDANRYSTIPIEIDPDAPGIADFEVRGAFVGSDIDHLLMSIADIHPIVIDRSDPDRIVLRRRHGA